MDEKETKRSNYYVFTCGVCRKEITIKESDDTIENETEIFILRSRCPFAEFYDLFCAKCFKKREKKKSNEWPFKDERITVNEYLNMSR